jgi:hypothetical protein
VPNTEIKKRAIRLAADQSYSIAIGSPVLELLPMECLASVLLFGVQEEDVYGSEVETARSGNLSRTEIRRRKRKGGSWEKRK